MWAVSLTRMFALNACEYVGVKGNLTPIIRTARRFDSAEAAHLYIKDRLKRFPRLAQAGAWGVVKLRGR